MAAATPDDPDKVLGTGVSIEELRQVLCSKVGADSQLTSWKAADIGDGKGFVSVMSRIELEWATPDPKLPKSIIAKVPTLKKLLMMFGGNDEMKEMMAGMTKEAYKVHNGECGIYETVNKLPDFPVPIAKIYATKKLVDQAALDNNASAYILMEDLSGKVGMVNIMKCESLTDGQTKELIRQLAKIHSWGYTNIEAFKPLELLVISDFYKKNMGPMNSLKEKLKVDLADKENEYYKLFGEGALDKYINGMEVTTQDVDQIPDLHHKYGVNFIPTTLTHGDVHTNNLLWKLDEKGEMTDEMLAFIDWQITSLQNPVTDLTRALNWPVAPTKRTKEYREQLLDTYYQTYQAQLGADKTMPFTREQLSQAFWVGLIVELKMMIPFMPTIAGQIANKQIPGVGPEHLPAMMNNIKRMFDELHELTAATKG